MCSVVGGHAKAWQLTKHAVLIVLCTTVAETGLSRTEVLGDI